MSQPERIWTVDGGQVKEAWWFQSDVSKDGGSCLFLTVVDGQRRSEGSMFIDGRPPTGFYPSRLEAVIAAIEWLTKALSPESIEADQRFRRDEVIRETERQRRRRELLVEYRAETCSEKSS